MPVENTPRVEGQFIIFSQTTDGSDSYESSIVKNQIVAIVSGIYNGNNYNQIYVIGLPQPFLCTNNDYYEFMQVLN